MTLATKLATAATAAVLLLPLLLLAASIGALTSATPHPSAPSPAALADIPPDYLTHYTRAATVCPGLDWTILAAIGSIESDHGRSTLPGVHNGHNGVLNGTDGARGPLQFLPATFAEVRRRHPDVGPDIYDPATAALAAAWYLCDSGARHGRDLHGAIFTYNRADWYVRDVLAQAHEYRAPRTDPSRSGPWVAPVPGQCTSGYGPRDGEFHHGLDIAAPIGTPIVAASSGHVLASGPADGYGLWIKIEHEGRITTTYGHNNRNIVRTGQHVQAGQPIAEIGNRGQSTGPHLHFEIAVRGQPVDPVKFYRRHTAAELCD